MIKKLILIVILALILAPLVACSSGEAAEEAPAEEAMEEEAMEEEEEGSEDGLVAILVIDDFGPKDEQIYEGTTDENCVVSTDGQRGHSGGVGGGSGDIHGELVYSEVQHQAETSHFTFEKSIRDGAIFTSSSGISTQSWLRDVELRRSDEYGRILLVAVDTEGFTTQKIREHIDEVLADLKQPSKLGDLEIPEIESFVLNMSFAVIPCELLDSSNPRGLVEEYLATICDDSQGAVDELDGLQEDLAALIGLEAAELTCSSINEKALTTTLDTLFADSVSEMEIGQALFGSEVGRVRMRLAYINDPDFSQSILDGFDGGDPLFSLLQRFRDETDGRVISIGAAGNSGYDIPFAPALWKGVLSVSATDTSSNAGDVAVSGIHSNTIDEGTSFAAPQLSLKAAIYLLEGFSASCISPDNNITIPPLSYTYAATPVSTPPAPWSKISLSDAAEIFCPDFPH